jgi:hypothetical protein
MSVKNLLPSASNPKSLLWEVSGNSLKQSSYFFGTMHLMCAEDTELSEAVKQVIKHVDQIYLEVDLDNASELLAGILDMRVQTGKTLQAVLSSQDYDKVKRFFETHQPHIPFSVLETQPPLMISSSLYELLLQCEHKSGVEMKIIDEAFKENKATKGLETIAFQASIFDAIPYEEQAHDLIKSIDNLEKNRTALDEMIRMYKEQDIEKLYELSQSQDNITSQYIDLLLYKRNVQWVYQFTTIAKDHSTLFAVGAGHLGGEKGVLQLLRNEGFVVTALAN